MRGQNKDMTNFSLISLLLYATAASAFMSQEGWGAWGVEGRWGVGRIWWRWAVWALGLPFSFTGASPLPAVFISAVLTYL